MKNANVSADILVNYTPPSPDASFVDIERFVEWVIKQFEDEMQPWDCFGEWQFDDNWEVLMVEVGKFMRANCVEMWAVYLETEKARLQRAMGRC